MSLVALGWAVCTLGWVFVTGLRIWRPDLGSRLEAGVIAYLSLLLLVNAIIRP